MQITKFGHSCILLDDGQTKILFDPGSYSDIPELAVDAIVITHKHQDHYDVEKIQKLLASSPNACIITNTEVKNELDKNSIVCEIVEQGSSITVGTFTLEGYGNDHAMIHPTFPIDQNTSYIINDKIFHPGDALITPPRQMDVLFLPLVAPWSKVSETLDYIEAANAKLNLPIHDAIIKKDFAGFFYTFAQSWCEKFGLKFQDLESNKPYEL